MAGGREEQRVFWEVLRGDGERERDRQTDGGRKRERKQEVISGLGWWWSGKASYCW